MSPFKSSGGRSLGKLLEGYKTSTLGQGFGSGGGSSSSSASGGTIANGIDDAGYRYFTFIEPGSLIVTGSATFDIFCVGGGGGGGATPPGNGSGGAGGGGIALLQNQDLTSGGYNVEVGTGGPGGS